MTCEVELSDVKAPPKDMEKAQPKSVTSYTVFSRYIKWKKGRPEVDVSGMLSRECYLEWLATRRHKKLKYPSQSYQRVFYAHIRGADKRKPFPREVEKELLRVLRDESQNPWKTIFEDDTICFGKRGFKSKGFHEASTLGDSSNDDFPMRSEDFSLELVCSDQPNDESSERFSSYFHASEPFDGNMYFRNTISPPPRDTTSPWDAVVRVLQTYVPSKVRQESLVKLNKRKVNFWSPAMIFYLEQMIDSNDYRFSWMFLFPSLEEQVFRNDRPTAEFHCTLGNTICWEDADILRMFGGSIVGMHLFEIHSSRVSFCYSCIGQIPAVFGNGKVWQRSVFQKCDGTKMVCLIYSEVSRGKEHIFTIQDQSDLFPSIMKSVCFI